MENHYSLKIEADLKGREYAYPYQEVPISTSYDTNDYGNKTVDLSYSANYGEFDQYGHHDELVLIIPGIQEKNYTITVSARALNVTNHVALVTATLNISVFAEPTKIPGKNPFNATEVVTMELIALAAAIPAIMLILIDHMLRRKSSKDQEQKNR